MISVRLESKTKQQLCDGVNQKKKKEKACEEQVVMCVPAQVNIWLTLSETSDREVGVSAFSLRIHHPLFFLALYSNPVLPRQNCARQLPPHSWPKRANRGDKQAPRGDVKRGKES